MEYTIPPTRGAYVRGGEHALKHYSEITAPEAGLELKTAASDYTRRVLLTFDLSDVPENAARIFFCPAYKCITGESPMRCDLHVVTNDWDENTVTWNTQPELGECIYTDGLVAEATEMDVTEGIKAAMDRGEKTLSLCMLANHPCTGTDRAALDVEKTALIATDEAREARIPTYIEDDPSLTDEQRALLAYLPRNWQLRVSGVKENRGDRFLMILQTDTHAFNRWDTLYGNNVKAATVFSGADLTVNLGDIIRGYKYDDDNTDNLRGCMDDLTRRYTEGNAAPVLMAIGNHDHNGMWCKLNEIDDLITKQEHFDRVQKPLHAHNGARMVTDEGNVCGDSLYSYIDFEKYHIRVVLVDTTDNGAEFSNFKVSERQLWWLENVALMTDKHVIIMTHTPFFVEFPDAGNRVPNGDRVMALVEQFIAAGGHFVAYLYGHTHKQSAVVDENGRRHMSFQNGGNNAEAVMIDTQSRTIETVGFGGSISRKVTY